MVKIVKHTFTLPTTYKILSCLYVFCFQRLWTFLLMNPVSQVRQLLALNLQLLSQQQPMETLLLEAILLSWGRWSDVEKQR